MAKTESITGPDGAPEIEINRMPFGRWFREIGWRHVIGVLAILFAAFPVLYVISASFNPLGTVASIGTLTAKRSLCHRFCFCLSQYRLYVLLLRQNIALQLINHWFHIYIMSEIKETPSLEVRNANGSHLTFAISFLHSTPSAEHIAVSLVNKQQVNIIGVEFT